MELRTIEDLPPAARRGRPGSPLIHEALEHLVNEPKAMVLFTEADLAGSEFKNLRGIEQACRRDGASRGMRISVKTSLDRSMLYVFNNPAPPKKRRR